MATAVLWFRRDLRLGDHPALAAAADAGAVLPLFVYDPELLAATGLARRARLDASLAALHASLPGGLTIRTGTPAAIVAQVAAEVGADTVHVSADYAPYGRRRDAAAADALLTAGRQLVSTGSPYAVAPGRIRKADGSAYKVWTPFHRAWRDHGWRAPAITGPDTATWLPALPGDPTPIAADVGAGETAAGQRWREFRDDGLADYDTDRDRADLDGTSRLSAALRFGELHPRTLLADLDDSPGADRFRREIAWREFYADVTFHAGSAWSWLRPGMAAMTHEPAHGAAFEAWCAGRTGFPFVDAGMRQLVATGWMHNRVRMVTASFLVKDLHIAWPAGAAFFLRHLLDGDVASNNQGWQWVAGSGTDAAPYFRIFNPVTQGLRFDPDGDYVRRWLPELRDLPGALAHEPWRRPDGPPNGYPSRIVDHGAERDEALRRYDDARSP